MKNILAAIACFLVLAGPSLANMTAAPPSAWDTLDDAIANGTAEKLRVVVNGSPVCGEHDPFYLGDVCRYDARLTRNRAGIVLYFEYDDNEPFFKTGIRLNVHAVKLDSEHGFNQNPDILEYAAKKGSFR
ncbi:MAG: hypothetical protein A2583_11150 [Bdellovibrionales bacterium RIFOXYD1_FULL_53_11]|nr:MAG: hypothetical protein A2583_11150 [Bdellovibrionales bacterium RIFOXYD1_FULL_53_11]